MDFVRSSAVPLGLLIEDVPFLLRLPSCCAVHCLQVYASLLRPAARQTLLLILAIENGLASVVVAWLAGCLFLIWLSICKRMNARAISSKSDIQTPCAARYHSFGELHRSLSTIYLYSQHDHPLGMYQTPSCIGYNGRYNGRKDSREGTCPLCLSISNLGALRGSEVLPHVNVDKLSYR